MMATQWIRFPSWPWRVTNKEASRYAADSVRLTVKDGTAYAQATDGRAVAIVTAEALGHADTDVLIPRTCKQSGPVFVCVDDDLAHIQKSPKPTRRGRLPKADMRRGAVTAPAIADHFPPTQDIVTAVPMGAVAVGVNFALLASACAAIRDADSPSPDHVTLIIEPNRKPEQHGSRKPIRVIGSGGFACVMPMTLNDDPKESWDRKAKPFVVSHGGSWAPPATAEPANA